MSVEGADEPGLSALVAPRQELCERPFLRVIVDVGLSFRRSLIGDSEETTMDISLVRDRATAFCEALDAGDVESAAAFMSPELRRNLGEVLALMPLPTNESTVVSVDRGGSGWNVVLRLLGETEEVELQTRWKDRDGEPVLVEASHIGQTELDAVEATAEEGEGEPAGAEG